MVAEMLLTEPALSAIWAALIVLSFPALLLLGNPTLVRHPGRAARDLLNALRGHGEGRGQRVANAAQAARLADEVRVAADQAAAAAERWQQRWAQATEDLNETWQAWLDADARLRDNRAAADWGTPWSAPSCAEYATRERFLHRAVSAAVDRGELPAAAVTDAVACHNGWDARLHPVEQELVLARTSAAWLRHRYERAATVERAAWHDAELAGRTRDSLRREATATALAAQRSNRRRIPRVLPWARRRRVIPAALRA